MNGQSFSLVPFRPISINLTISGDLALNAGVMEVFFLLEGDLNAIRIDPPATACERRDLLWQTTCLEVFLALPGAQPYWEFNLSPAGHWNVYRLENYRQGLAPEPAYAQLPFTVHRHHDQLSLCLRSQLPPLLAAPAAAPLEAAITAVIHHGDGTLSYWARTHPVAEADFHHRGGFQLLPKSA